MMRLFLSCTIAFLLTACVHGAGGRADIVTNEGEPLQLRDIARDRVALDGRRVLVRAFGFSFGGSNFIALTGFYPSTHVEGRLICDGREGSFPISGASSRFARRAPALADSGQPSTEIIFSATFHNQAISRFVMWEREFEGYFDEARLVRVTGRTCEPWMLEEQ